MLSTLPSVIGGLAALALPPDRPVSSTSVPRMPPPDAAPLPAGVERVWIGPELHANRLADWRLADGRAECREGRPNFPLRTLFWLTRTTAGGTGTFTARVRLAAVDGGPWSPDALAGMLVGCGGGHVDWRLSAQMHHLPAEDGGLLAVIGADGRVGLRDASRTSTKGGNWSVNAKLEPDADVPLLADQERGGDGFGAGGPVPVDLLLSAGPGVDGFTVRLTARRADDGALLSEAVARGVDVALVDGSVALVSSRGAEGGAHGFAFEGWTLEGNGVARHPERARGPVLCVLYTVERGLWKLTAQLPPLGADDPREARLEVLRDGEWSVAARTGVVEDSWTAPFRVEGWDASWEARFRVVVPLRGAGGVTETAYGGRVRAEPRDARELVVAGFTGHKCYTGGLRWNAGGFWFPHAELVAAVRHHDPDLLFFSGDQVYEGDFDVAVRGQDVEASLLDYLYKWSRWCWAFEGLTRDRPAVVVPDDHDVYHGNIWGAGGVSADVRSRSKLATDRGGYRMPVRFVNAVHRTQVSHLPDPWDPTPLVNGVTTYHTTLGYGGLSCAILADRMWKSAPAVLLERGDCVNGWFQEGGFDPVTGSDADGAELLGPSQEAMLEEWALDWSGGAWAKLVLSQTIFANVATLPESARSDGVTVGLAIQEPGTYAEGERRVADADSNGWPRTPRDRALRAMRRGFALHLAGDQHLGSTVHYGVDAWEDAGLALCVPSVANTFPRRWFPPGPGEGREPDAPRYTGRYRDGFGNRITVLAVSNPYRTGVEPTGLHDRAPGYGILRFDRDARTVTIENWPRWADPSREDARPYPGWPITVRQRDGYGREPTGWLPEIVVEGREEAVVQVALEEGGEVVYALRIPGTRFRPFVFADGPHAVRVGEPDTGSWETVGGLIPSPTPPVEPVVVRLR